MMLLFSGTEVFCSSASCFFRELFMDSWCHGPFQALRKRGIIDVFAFRWFHRHSISPYMTLHSQILISRNERLLRVTDYDNSAESSAESSVENSYTDDNPQYDGAGSSVSTRSGASNEFRSGPTKTFDAQRTWNRIPFLMSPPTTGFSQNSASSQFTPSSAQTPWTPWNPKACLPYKIGYRLAKMTNCLQM